MENEMRTIKRARTLLLTIGIFGVGPLAFAAPMAPVKYEITITNSGPMPVSPPLIYIKTGTLALSAPNNIPSRGFVKLCTSGAADERSAELSKDPSVTFQTTGSGPILPGSSATFQILVADPLKQSIHVESMYGKTKDACALASINSHQLVALRQEVTPGVKVRDEVVVTGVYLDARIPMGESYLDPKICGEAKDAVTCLRTFGSTANTTTNRIRTFNGYLPTVLTALEMCFGSDQVTSLLVPTSGTLSLNAKIIK
jgi:hypothetical protein